MIKKQTDTRITEQDTRVVLGELYYTVSGAMKELCVGRNAIVNAIKEGTLQVFRHPSGNLFSKGALLDWIARKTSKVKK